MEATEGYGQKREEPTRYLQQEVSGRPLGGAGAFFFLFLFLFPHKMMGQARRGGACL